MRTDSAAEDEADGAEDAMASISRQIRGLSTGDRAGLRRIYLTERHEADGVVIGLLHRAKLDIPVQPEAFAPWRLVAHVAALLAGTAGDASHAAGTRLGFALQSAGYSENRLLRLTAARGVAVHGQIIRAARVLAQKGQGPVNLWTVFDLAARNPRRIEAARLRIAQDFYTAAARSEGDSK